MAEPTPSASPPAGAQVETAGVTQTAPPAASALNPMTGAPLPDQIGPYRVLRLIGQGGMGAVYEAMQQAPSRAVALKVVRPGYLSRAALRRFHFESEVLGRLQHPNIAAIYDAGVAQTPQGQQPYFAMEFIAGQPLHLYSDGRNLSHRQKLDLLAQIADAVHYAHSRGVVHRDLKPANILVTESDVPKILDFGLAKATDADIHATSADTEIGALLGTLPYMAPEQTGGNPDEIDTRTDIYALGVIAYQLLSGRLPHDLTRRAMVAAIQIIQTEEPSRLSSLNRTLGGDIETIVFKAMEKDKSQRYQSASDLAADIRRYLADQPIIARPASWGYQFTKFARRNRLLVASALAIVMVLLAGVVGTTHGMLGQRRLRLEADQRAIAAERAKAAEETAKEEAVKQRNTAEFQAYVADIAAAGAALDNNETSHCLAWLNACPEPLRNWEWRHLRAACDRSLFVIQGSPVAFSPDGKRLLAIDQRGTAQILDLNSGKELPFQKPVEHAASAAFSRDGSQIAAVTAGDHGTVVRILDAITGIESTHYDVPKESLTQCNPFAPWGSRIILPGPNNTARVYDAATKTNVSILRGLAGRIAWASFSPNGLLATTVSTEGTAETARVWEVSTGKQLTFFQGNQAPVARALFSKDGTRLFTMARDLELGVWNLTTSTQITILRPSGAGYHFWTLLDESNGVPFSPDGSKIALAADDGTAQVFDANSGQELFALRGHTAFVTPGASFSPDGTRIVTTSRDDTARVWDASSGEELATLQGHSDMVMDAFFSPDGSLIATRCKDSTAGIWDAATAETPTEMQGDGSASFDAVSSPDGTRIVVTGPTGVAGANNALPGTARIFDATTGRFLVKLPGHQDKVEWAAFSADGKKVVTASRDKTAKIWDAATAELLVTLAGHGNWVFSAALNNDGTRVVTSSEDGTSRIWDAASGKELAVLPRQKTMKGGASFSPDGQRVLTICKGNILRVWDAISGKQLFQSDDAFFAAFSRNGEAIVVGGKSNRIVDGHSGKPLAALRSEAGGMSFGEFSPDGSRIVGACNGDHTVRVWNAASGEQTAVLRDHGALIFVACFSRDGSRILTSGLGDPFRLWDTATGREVMQFHGHDDVEHAFFSGDGTTIVAQDINNVRVFDGAPWSQRYAELKTR